MPPAVYDGPLFPDESKPQWYWFSWKRYRLWARLRYKKDEEAALDDWDFLRMYSKPDHQQWIQHKCWQTTYPELEILIRVK